MAKKAVSKKAPAKKAPVEETKAPEVEEAPAPEAPAKKAKLPGGKPRCKKCGRLLVAMNLPHVNSVCGICAPPKKVQKSVLPGRR